MILYLILSAFFLCLPLSVGHRYRAALSFILPPCFIASHLFPQEIIKVNLFQLFLPSSSGWFHILQPSPDGRSSEGPRPAFPKLSFCFLPDFPVCTVQVPGYSAQLLYVFWIPIHLASFHLFDSRSDLLRPLAYNSFFSFSPFGFYSICQIPPDM